MVKYKKNLAVNLPVDRGNHLTQITTTLTEGDLLKFWVKNYWHGQGWNPQP